MIKVVVADGNEYAIERIKALLEGTEYEVCAEAENGQEALELIQKNNPEIAIINITMPVLDGLKLARSLEKTNYPAIIFTSAYGEYALEAFSTIATGYLMKPVRQEQLLISLNKARTLSPKFSRQTKEVKVGETDEPKPVRKNILARRRGNLEIIPIEDIYYFQADQKYVSVRHKEGEVIIEESLKSLEKDLSERFIRIHRNALVSRSSIKRIARKTNGRLGLSMKDIDDELEVSRRHAPNVRRFVVEQ